MSAGSGDYGGGGWERRGDRSSFHSWDATVLAKQLSQNIANDFSADENSGAGYIAKNFKQDGFCIEFKIQNSKFKINSIGKHNMENALAAVAVANVLD